jgi:hypothetical protein
MTKRRRFLEALAVGTVGAAGCLSGDQATTPTDRPEEVDDASVPPTPASRLEKRFDTAVNLLDIDGVDGTARTRIDEVLQSRAIDDTLFFFPPGQYRIGSVTFKGISNLGLVGHDATFVLDEPGRNIFLAFRQVEDVLLDGFVADNTADNTAAWIDFKCRGGTNVVRNYAVADFGDVEARTNGFTLMVEGADTSLLLEDVDLSEGAINGAATFVFRREDFFDPSRKPGSVTFRNCVMKNWGAEGLYASSHSGPIRVLGGEYANNAIVQVRIGSGHAPTRAVVRDVDVRVDRVQPYIPTKRDLLRGIWLKEGDEALVENCHVEIRGVKPGQTPGGIVVNKQFGRATIRNCDVTTDVAKPGIVIEDPVTEYDPQWMPSLDHLPPRWDVTLQNVTVDGDCPNADAVRVEGRDNCRFQNLSIDVTGPDADGLALQRAVNCHIAGGAVSASRYPITASLPPDLVECAAHLNDTTLETSDVSQDSVLASNDSGAYCIGTETRPSAEPPEDRTLALTRTTAESTDSGSESSRNGKHTLFGTWFADE